MKTFYPNYIPDEIVKKWTPQAKYCFEIKGNCQKCNVHKWLETECVMKYTVIALFKRHGNPPEHFFDVPKAYREPEDVAEPKLTKEYILNNLHNGRSLKDIAKETGYTVSMVNYWSNEIYGIDANYEKGAKF